MVQDLQMRNEAVIPTVPNSYVILREILPSTKLFTALDLKGAFFSISLAKGSQYLSVFEWEAPRAKHQQMIWTFLPQGFRDSPSLFGQVLSLDLLDLDLGPKRKLLQYVYDPLICSSDEKMSNNMQFRF